ncbi:MAG TPA: TRAP transporter fused permease subunit [Beijerinckiaceae bacterium]|jgi:TRAP transporter 4TM/12TM fusion protein
MTDQETAGPAVMARPAWLTLATNVLSVALVVGAIAYATDAYGRLGVTLYGEQFVAGMLAGAFLLLFLTVPVKGGSRVGAPPWYDIVLGLAGLAAAGYMSLRFVELGTQMFFAPWDGLAASVVVIALALEGVRRTTGWALVIIVVTFLVYALLGHLMSGPLAARPSEPAQLAFYLGFDSNAILGTPIMVACTIVIAFVLFGALLQVTGGSAFFTDLALALMGRYRGGSAKIAVVGSALFGSISGSAVANVVATGVVTIPMMKKGGYPPHQAAAIEAVASTGGSLMPPVMGAAAFVMAEFLQVSYGQVMLAALIPAILYYAVLFIVSDLEAARVGIERVEENLIPRARDVMRDGWFFPIPFVVLIYCLFWLNLRAEESALWASLTLALLALVFGYKGQRPRPLDLLAAVRDTGLGVLDIIMICCGAGIVIGVLAVTGLGFGLTLTLVSIAGKSLIVLLLLCAAVSIVLGMGMPTVGVYVLLAALVAPAMIEAGVTPMGAHLFVLYFGMMSFITPPVAVAAFAAASIAKADPFRTGFTAMRFGWIAYIVPFLFAFSPTLIMDGPPLRIAVDFATALASIWLISAAVVGYGVRLMSVPERVLAFLAGFMLLMPSGLFAGAIWISVAGAALGALIVGRELATRRAASAA